MPVASILHTIDCADPGDLSVGDRVRWSSSGGTAYGRIEQIETDGSISAEPDGPTMEGTEDDPAYGVRVYDLAQTDDGQEWQETDTLTVHRAGALTPIDAFPQDRSAQGGTRLYLVSSTSSGRRLDVAGVDTMPTQAMRDAARRGLEMVEEGKGGSGLKDKTKRNARRIRDGESLSRDHVMSGSAFWGRNGNFCPISDASDAQATSANLWGGCGAGQEWFPRTADRIREAEKEVDNTVLSAARAPRVIVRTGSRPTPHPNTPPDESPAVLTSLQHAAARLDAIDCASACGRVVELDATNADLAVINDRHRGLDLGQSDVLMFRDFAASTGPMRGHRLRFTERAIERFASLAEEGRAYNLHHDEKRFVGSTLRADVVERKIRGIDATWLAVDWYAITRDASEQRRQDLMDIRTGLQYTSIRFTGGEWTMMEDSDEPFMLVDDNPPDTDQQAFDRLDMPHISRVELGAVQGAGATPHSSNQ